MSPEIAPIDTAQLHAALPDLIELLRDAVADGASIGFLPPLAEAEAHAYWEEIAADIAAGRRVLLGARSAGRLVGCVQLELAGKPNARHRAEVQKLIVHTSARRQGIARALLSAADAAARANNRSLLVLDTRAGDPAEHLYRSYGYTEAGRIPHYAANPKGGLDTTVLFFRLLDL
jgi:ribosomal protein S18 acetylase RimI-like enzyme